MALMTIEMLEHGERMIQELDFKADDRDRSQAAFETFRKAVLRVSRSTRRGERGVLEGLEPKRKYFEFLLAFADRCFMQRSRVAEVMKCLLEADPWQEVADADPDLCSAIQGVSALVPKPALVPTPTVVRQRDQAVLAAQNVSQAASTLAADPWATKAVEVRPGSCKLSPSQVPARAPQKMDALLQDLWKIAPAKIPPTEAARSASRAFSGKDRLSSNPFHAASQGQEAYNPFETKRATHRAGQGSFERPLPT